jgi:hypothetical protein
VDNAEYKVKQQPQKEVFFIKNSNYNDEPIEPILDKIRQNMVYLIGE